MGVKTHFLLATGNNHFVDRAAFTWLKSQYDNEVSHLRIPKIVNNSFGWRKLFPLYYKALRKAGFGISMSTMKCRYPHRDNSYNSIFPRKRPKSPPPSRAIRAATDRILHPEPAPPRPPRQPQRTFRVNLQRTGRVAPR